MRRRRERGFKLKELKVNEWMSVHRERERGIAISIRNRRKRKKRRGALKRKEDLGHVITVFFFGSKKYAPYFSAFLWILEPFELQVYPTFAFFTAVKTGRPHEISQR